MLFSPKQYEYLRGANRRWNVKTGATRSGKTYLDYFIIPMRIREVEGKMGLVVLLGNTKGTLQRNIIEPLQRIWGASLVSGIRSDNTASLFGERCYCLGADKVSQVDRLRGSSIKYCYGDEVVTWHEDVFTMLKSRLDKPYSRFDGTCNPDNPKHWFKRFLDSDFDIYQQTYRIDDNPFLDPGVMAEMQKEHAGTVYYDRFILGKWIAAEGIIYRRFADNPAAYQIPDGVIPKDFMRVAVGVDFGGNRSGTAFVATGILPGYSRVVALASERHTGEIDPEQLGVLFVEFAEHVMAKYGRADVAYCDSAESILIKGMEKAARNAVLPIRVAKAAKKEIIDRIRLVTRLLAQNRIALTGECQTLSNALSTALWDSKKLNDTRLDDGSSDIDTLDAFEYTIEREAQWLIRTG